MRDRAAALTRFERYALAEQLSGFFIKHAFVTRHAGKAPLRRNLIVREAIPHVVTTDGGGNATVRMTLTGNPADFVRAEDAP